MDFEIQKETLINHHPQCINHSRINPRSNHYQPRTICFWRGQPLKTERQSFRAVPCDGCAPGKAGLLPTQGEGTFPKHRWDINNKNLEVAQGMFIELLYCWCVYYFLNWCYYSKSYLQFLIGKKEGCSVYTRTPHVYIIYYTVYYYISIGM